MTSTQDRSPGWQSAAGYPEHGRFHRVGGLVFTEGLVGSGPGGTIVGPGDCGRQLEQAMANLAATLHGAGSSLDRVVKVAYYVRDARELPEWALGAWYVDCWPVCTVVEHPALAAGVLVEIEAVAKVGNA